MKIYVLLISLLLMLVLSSCREQSKEELFQQGMEFVKNGNQQAAITLFKDALDKDPNYLDARMQLGFAYLETDKIEQAEIELEKAQRQDPNNNVLTIKLAEIYLKSKRPEEVIQLLKNLPTNFLDKQVEPLYLLAESYKALNQLSTSEEYFLKALALDSKHLESQLGYANLLYMTERNVEGDNYLDSVITDHPEETSAYYLKLRKSLYLSDKESAIDALEKIRQLDSGDYYAAYVLGMLYIDSGNLEAAQQLASKLLLEKPDNPVGLRIEGVVLYLKEDYERSIEKLQKSLLAMQDLAGFYFLGLANYSAGQLEQALSNFQKALDKAPNYDRSRLMVAQTLIKQGRIEDGIRQAKYILDENPQSAEAHNILGGAYLLQGQYDLAMTHIDEAIRIDPHLAKAHLKKGLFSIAAGKKEQAEKDFLNAIDAAPEVLNTRLLLAKYYLAQNNYPKALETLEAALAISPTNALIYNYIAAAQMGQQRKEEAVENLKKAKEIKPDFFAPYINLSNIYMSEKNYSAALAELESMLSFNPSHIEAILRVAALHEYLNHKDKASQYYQKAFDTGSPVGCLALAAYQMRAGEKDAALKTLKAGYDAHPDIPELAAIYGETLQKYNQLDQSIPVFIKLEEMNPGLGKKYLMTAHLMKKDFAAAKEIAEQAIAEKPSSALGYQLLSSFFAYQADWQNAINVLNQGLNATHKDLTLSMSLATVHLQSGSKEKALQTCEEILTQQPNFTPALFLAASIYDSAGDKKRAKAQYERILSLDENHVGALNNLAMLSLDVYNDKLLALEYAARGFRIKPNDPRIIDTLGYALLKNGQIEKAIVFLEKANSLMPNVAEVKLHLAMAYKAAGRINEAVASLVDINESNADQSLVQQAKTMLKDLN